MLYEFAYIVRNVRLHVGIECAVAKHCFLLSEPSHVPDLYDSANGCDLSLAFIFISTVPYRGQLESSSLEHLCTLPRQSGKGAGKGTFTEKIEERHLCQHYCQQPPFCQHPCQPSCQHFSGFGPIQILYQVVRIIKLEQANDILMTMCAAYVRGRDEEGLDSGRCAWF